MNDGVHQPFHVGCLYRHRANTSVAMEAVSKPFFSREKMAWSFRIMWWNIGSCHEGWPMGITERIVIAAADRHRWLPWSPTHRISPKELTLRAQIG